MEDHTENSLTEGLPLIQNIYILGLSAKSIRNMFLDSIFSTEPEIIIQLPPSNTAASNVLKAIFRPFNITLQSSAKYPSIFSTSLTDSQGRTEYLHCLRLHEKVSPTIIEETKERRNPLGFMSFVENPYSETEEKEQELYTEIVICLKTSATYVDIFRKILKNLYSYLHSIERDWNSCLVSVNFLKSVVFLLNDLVTPSKNTKLSLSFGSKKIEFPQEKEESIGVYERCIEILLDLLDVKNILGIWECILLGKSVMLLSSDPYTIYLILQALIFLIFPFKPTQFCVPFADLEDLPSILSNKPVIVGLNPRDHPISHLKTIDNDLNFLNIDSNSLEMTEHPKMCDCLRTKLGQKLKCLKVFYYVDKDRINIYRMISLEKAINEPDLVQKMRSLQDLSSSKKKNRKFVKLVRKIFFSIFSENLSSFPKLVIEQSFSGIEFQRDLFFQKMQRCQNCESEGFWNTFFESNNFKEFLRAYERSEDYTKKFLKLCESSLKKDKPTEKHLNLSIKIPSQKLFKNIFDRFRIYPKETSCKKFTAESGLALLEDYRKEYENIEDLENTKKKEEPQDGEKSAPVDKLKDFKQCLETAYFEKSAFDLPNIFYGDFCVLQMLKGLVQPISETIQEISRVNRGSKEFKLRSAKSQEIFEDGY